MGKKLKTKFITDDDSLIQGLINSKGKNVEVMAFGMVYSGKLMNVDPDDGIAVISDGDDSVTLEIERIESMSVQTL